MALEKRKKRMMMLGRPSAAGGEAEAMPMILVGADNGQEAARHAIETIGGRLMTQLGWQEAASSLAQHAACSVLVVETEGTRDDVLAAALPRIDTMATALDIPVVVALDQRSIDVVAATMLSTRHQLLCAPSMADRVAALAIAARRGDTTPAADVVRENEAARLHRLNEEVARIADVLARLTRHGSGERGGSSIVADHPVAFGHERLSDVTIDPAEVRRAIRARRMRDQHFGSGLFEDPAWDILLDLFAAELERAQVSVSSLCIAAAVAPTTALRWIAKLTDSGLLERHPDPFDRRRAFMELSPDTARAMRNHVAMLRQAGLPFG